MNKTQTQVKLERELRATLSAELERALACAALEDTVPELLAEAVAEFQQDLLGSAVEALALEAFRALDIPRTARRIRATIEPDSIGYKKANIECKVLIADTEENIIDLRRMRGCDVEIIGSQLELSEDPTMTNLDPQQQLPLDAEPEPVRLVLYHVMDPEGVVVTQGAVERGDLDAVMDAYGAARFPADELDNGEGWSLLEVAGHRKPDGYSFPREQPEPNAEESQQAEQDPLPEFPSEPVPEDADSEPEAETEAPPEPKKGRGKKKKNVAPEPEREREPGDDDEPLPDEVTPEVPASPDPKRKEAEAPAQDPSTFTPEQAKDVAARHLAEGAEIGYAAQQAGVPVTTIKRWLANDKAFAGRAMAQ